MRIRLLLISTILVQSALCLNVIKQWNQLKFVFPDAQTQQEAETKGYYIPGASLPLDLKVFYQPNGQRRFFITIPRFGPGRPISLGVINPDATDPLAIAPYPNYAMHDNQGLNRDGITSAWRIAIDECSRLWVMDNGKISDVKYFEPQILGLDLSTDKLIYRHRLDPAIINRQRNFLVNIVAEVRDPQNGCQHTYLYMGDVDSYAIMVHDVFNNKTWRVDNKLFFPHPSAGTFNIAGETFEMMDGVLSMALSPRNNNESDRTLFFHSLASYTENKVMTSVLRNESLYANGGVADPSLFQVLEYRRSSQSGPTIINKDIMMFGLTKELAIACWNIRTKYHWANIHIVAQDSVKLQFASGVTIVRNPQGKEELWVMTNRFQKAMTGTMRLDETNFRIMTAKVEDLLSSSPCQYPFDHPNVFRRKCY